MNRRKDGMCSLSHLQFTFCCISQKIVECPKYPKRLLQITRHNQYSVCSMLVWFEVQRLTGQECSEGKKKYNCTLSLTSELDGDAFCGQRQ